MRRAEKRRLHLEAQRRQQYLASGAFSPKVIQQIHIPSAHFNTKEQKEGINVSENDVSMKNDELERSRTSSSMSSASNVCTSPHTKGSLWPQDIHTTTHLLNDQPEVQHRQQHVFLPYDAGNLQLEIHSNDVHEKETTSRGFNSHTLEIAKRAQRLLGQRQRRHTRQLNSYEPGPIRIWRPSQMTVSSNDFDDLETLQCDVQISSISINQHDIKDVATNQIRSSASPTDQQTDQPTDQPTDQQADQMEPTTMMQNDTTFPRANSMTQTDISETDLVDSIRSEPSQAYWPNNLAQMDQNVCSTESDTWKHTMNTTRSITDRESNSPSFPNVSHNKSTIISEQNEPRNNERQRSDYTMTKIMDTLNGSYKNHELEVFSEIPTQATPSDIVLNAVHRALPLANYTTEEEAELFRQQPRMWQIEAKSFLSVAQQLLPLLANQSIIELEENTRLSSETNTVDANGTIQSIHDMKLQVQNMTQALDAIEARARELLILVPRTTSNLSMDHKERTKKENESTTIDAFRTNTLMNEESFHIIHNTSLQWIYDSQNVLSYAIDIFEQLCAFHRTIIDEFDPLTEHAHASKDTQPSMNHYSEQPDTQPDSSMHHYGEQLDTKPSMRHYDNQLDTQPDLSMNSLHAPSEYTLSDGYTSIPSTSRDQGMMSTSSSPSKNNTKSGATDSDLASSQVPVQTLLSTSRPYMTSNISLSTNASSSLPSKSLNPSTFQSPSLVTMEPSTTAISNGFSTALSHSSTINFSATTSLNASTGNSSTAASSNSSGNHSLSVSATSSSKWSDAFLSGTQSMNAVLASALSETADGGNRNTISESTGSNPPTVDPTVVNGMYPSSSKHFEELDQVCTSMSELNTALSKRLAMRTSTNEDLYAQNIDTASNDRQQHNKSVAHPNKSVRHPNRTILHYISSIDLPSKHQTVTNSSHPLRSSVKPPSNTHRSSVRTPSSAGKTSVSPNSHRSLTKSPSNLGKTGVSLESHRSLTKTPSSVGKTSVSPNSRNSNSNRLKNSLNSPSSVNKSELSTSPQSTSMLRNSGYSTEIAGSDSSMQGNNSVYLSTPETYTSRTSRHTDSHQNYNVPHSASSRISTTSTEELHPSHYASKPPTSAQQVEAQNRFTIGHVNDKTTESSTLQNSNLYSSLASSLQPVERTLHGFRPVQPRTMNHSPRGTTKRSEPTSRQLFRHSPSRISSSSRLAASLRTQSPNVHAQPISGEVGLQTPRQTRQRGTKEHFSHR